MTKYLGIDYGKKRVGLSFSDGVGVAVPIEPILCKGKDLFWGELTKVVNSRRVDAFVVGYPVGMSGQQTQWTHEVQRFMEELQRQYQLPVHRSDERLTSYQVQMDCACHRLQSKYGQKEAHRRTGKDDSRAAALILQDFLDEQEQKTKGC